MKLYNLDNSPFAARVRIQIRHKQLPVEVCDPPHALRTADFKSAFPLGKVPVLDLLDGNAIGESTVIMNYLEERFPQPSMRPSEPLLNAHNEMLIRYTDNHLSIGLSPLFQEFFGVVKGNTSLEERPNRFDILNLELDKLDRLLEKLPPFEQRELQTGDLCLVSNIYYVFELAKFFGNDDVIGERQQVNNWHAWALNFAAVRHEIKVMDKAHQAVIQSLKS